MTTTRIPQSFIRDIIGRSDIVEIVQARIPLKKKGQNHSGRCPFHDEKTPSFSVSETKQFYYCFGCGAHGNVLNFLMNYDRMEFLDAIQYLATQQGIDIPKIESYTADRSYDALFPIMQQAAAYYSRQLTNHAQAINYLKSRGITGETAKLFSIGFAPPGWDNLIKALDKDPKSHSYLTQTGMAIDRDRNSLYDRFRNRILFPIQDIRGRVIAFGGRTLEDEQPKYLNSPETPIFHKGKELYGLYQVRQSHQKLERLLVVEGYMDVVSLFQHGITYAVATLGTAVNPKHLQKCLRFTNEIVFCFDGDTAGRNAAWKALTIAMPMLRDGITMRFLFLPEGEDPDSSIQKIGLEGFQKYITEAQALQEIFFKELTIQFPGSSIEAKAGLAKTAKEYISQMPPGIYQELLYDALAKKIQVTRQELEQVAAPVRARHIAELPVKINTNTLPLLTQHCLNLLLQEPNLATRADHLDFLHESENKADTLLLKLIHIFKEHPELPIGQLLNHWEDPTEQALIAKFAAKELVIAKEGFTQEFLDTLNTMRQQAHQKKIQKLVEKAKLAPLTEAEKQRLNQLLLDKSSQQFLDSKSTL